MKCYTVFLVRLIALGALLAACAHHQSALSNRSEDKQSTSAWSYQESLKSLNLPADSILLAMRSELKRQMDSLRLGDSPHPYFISFSVWEIQEESWQASLGSVTKTKAGSERYIDVDIRVGDYHFDNTHFDGNVVFGPSLRQAVPEDMDTSLIKQALWAASDARYKVAIENYAQKKAFFKDRERQQQIPDFSKQQVTMRSFSDTRIIPDSALVTKNLQALSASLIPKSWLLESRFSFKHYYSKIYYVDSEGSTYTQNFQENTVSGAMLTQAKDGQPLWDYLRLSRRDSLRANDWDSLPALVSDRIGRLEALRNSDAINGYRGPVLFDGSSSGALIFESLLRPQEHLRNSIGGYREPNLLLSLRGRRYYPAEINIVDQPQLSHALDHYLYGYYPFDHQGQESKTLELIVNGMLKDFYRGKEPVEGLGAESNGHWRYSGGYPGVVLVSSSKALSEKSLEKQLLKLSKFEGNLKALVVRRLLDEDAFQLLRHPFASQLLDTEASSSQGAFVLPSPVALDMVDVNTGISQPVRGLWFVPIDTKLLRGISGLGSKPYLYQPLSSCSILSPSILMELLDLRPSKAHWPQAIPMDSGLFGN